MFLFISRFIKGLIVGWIMSLLMYLVKRALAKSFGQMPQQQSPSRPQSPQPSQQSAGDVVETIWAGMTTDQLRAAFGTPRNKETIKGGEIWTYPDLNGQGGDTRITIENGIVRNWDNKKED